MLSSSTSRLHPRLCCRKSLMENMQASGLLTMPRPAGAYRGPIIKRAATRHRWQVRGGRGSSLVGCRYLGPRTAATYLPTHASRPGAIRHTPAVTKSPTNSSASSSSRQATNKGHQCPWAAHCIAPRLCCCKKRARVRSANPQNAHSPEGRLGPAQTRGHARH